MGDWFHIITGDKKTTKHWTPKIATWEKLVRYMKKPSAWKECGGYVPVEISKTNDLCVTDGELSECLGYHRRIAAVRSAGLLTLDADSAGEDFLDRLSGLSGLAHSTFSHDPDSGIYKYRALIRVSRPMTGNEKRLVTRQLMREIGWDIFDKSCASPEHFMYWPSVHPDRRFEFLELNGEPLDVDSYAILGDLSEAPARPKPVPADLSVTATTEERTAALRELTWRVEELAGRGDGERTPFMFASLRTLYGYALGGCLSRDEVDDAMLGAYEDSGHTEQKYLDQCDNAWALAEAIRPVVVPSVEEDFGCRLGKAEEDALLGRLFRWALRQDDRGRALRWVAKTATADGVDPDRLRTAIEKARTA